ncbi:MAG TPA: TIGR00645 family protein [Acetobacteraceae bacterium]|nr:TIGR00645 family protein [Acetobacteraceae bacterium]
MERWIFRSRWLLAPFYLALTAGLVLLLVKFAQKAVELFTHALQAGSDDAIVGVLSLIDLSLVANLVLMVMFAGYENFVSRFELAGHRDRPEWMEEIDFPELKVKLMASIVAISAIHVLEDFMHVEQISNRELAWGVGIHLTFVASGVLLAVMDRVGGHLPASRPARPRREPEA